MLFEKLTTLRSCMFCIRYGIITSTIVGVGAKITANSGISRFDDLSRCSFELRNATILILLVLRAQVIFSVSCPIALQHNLYAYKAQPSHSSASSSGLLAQKFGRDRLDVILKIPLRVTELQSTLALLNYHVRRFHVHSINVPTLTSWS
jgi:hypothetical protein